MTACNAAARAAIAHAIRDGFLTDATGRRIYLSSAILVLEARRTSAPARGLGFGARTATVRDPGPPGAPAMDLAAVLVGDELAAECDLVVSPPAAAGDGAGRQAGRLLRALAARNRAAGVDLRWSPAVETFIGAGSARLPTTRLRERFVEEQVGRVARLRLRDGILPRKVTLALSPSGLAVEPTTREIIRLRGDEVDGASVPDPPRPEDRH